MLIADRLEQKFLGGAFGAGAVALEPSLVLRPTRRTENTIDDGKIDLACAVSSLIVLTVALVKLRWHIGGSLPQCVAASAVQQSIKVTHMA